MVQSRGQESRFDFFFRMTVEQLGSIQFSAPPTGGILDVGVLEEVTDGDAASE